ncbi:hypothetical protein [Flagellimonas abyssi]|uniref:Imm33-like domain-containing protein n=1 Tax=Flagellimonas abyssi TaxID=2864871 RepID=A0ABS7EWP4_9FLAO|nr:hypothetical protein [Allomuricauda abyssi]MBW8201956.1 hypothetical protein [Allomuricauda abyssi]
MDLTKNEYISEQKKLCLSYGAKYQIAQWGEFIGLGKNFDPKANPLNGLRHPKDGNTTGWYIWSGQDFDTNDDTFFEPVHLNHLIELCPDIVKYLGLPAGWRFLYAEGGNYEDVWRDASLLNV